MCPFPIILKKVYKLEFTYFHTFRGEEGKKKLTPSIDIIMATKWEKEK